MTEKQIEETARATAKLISPYPSIADTEIVAAAIRDAIAAERKRWVAAARKADAAGYDHQAFTILHEMGAARE